MTEQRRSGWTLFSPLASEGLSDGAAVVSVKPAGALPATSSQHQGGFFLSDAAFDGWRFGLLQESLHPAGLQAFVQSPEGVEATVVSDLHAPPLERLSVLAETGYVGAFRVALPSLVSLPDVIEGFRRALPLLRAEFERAEGRRDVA